MKNAVCSALVLLMSPLSAAGQTPSASGIERLSLDEAVQLAVAQNLTLKTAQAQVERADEAVAVARSHRLPSFETSLLGAQLLTPVGFTFPAGALGSYPGVGPLPSTDTRITTPQQPTAYVSAQVSQPLTQLVRIGRSINLAEAEKAAAREQLRSQQLTLVTNVKQLYFAILQTESAVTATDDAIALYRELDRQIGERVAQKVALRSDAFDVQVRLAQAELDRTTRSNTLESQKEQLNQLLGRDIHTPFAVDEFEAIALADVNLDAARTRALSNHPDLEQARLGVKQAELEYQLKKAERIPDVSLAVSYSSYVNIDVLPRNLAMAGVQVKWEPFDWGRKGHQLADKSLAIEQARFALRDRSDRIVLDVDDRFRKLTEARAMLHVVDLAQQAARERLRVKASQFEHRAALLTDVLQMRAEVSNADDHRQQALAAFWTAKVNFERAIGEGVVQ